MMNTADFFFRKQIFFIGKHENNLLMQKYNNKTEHIWTLYGEGRLNALVRVVIFKLKDYDVEESF